jgi:hypothetical protein
MRSLVVVSLQLLLFMVLIVSVRGEEATQTDWSAGPGFPGPVAQWQRGFTDSDGIDWAKAPGGFTLLPALPTEHLITSTFGEPAGAAAADLDGDNDNDIVATAYQGNEVAWWENDGAGGGWTEHLIDANSIGPTCVCPVDMDGDTDIDVVIAAENGDEIAWYENDGAGGGWTKRVVDPSVNGPFSVLSADFDNDDDVDLCGAAFYSADILWWENLDGSGHSWARHEVDGALAGAWWAAPGDINRDEVTDIVAIGHYVHDVCWYENDGAGGWTKHFIDANFANPVMVRVKDFEGDLDEDVLSVSYGGTIAWWENDGTGGGWSKHIVASGLAQSFCARAEDLDADGDQDVIGTERAGNRVFWWENVDGLGTLWLKHKVDETCDGPNDVLASYIDADDDMDIIATYSWDNTIEWYEEVNDYGPSGLLESSVLDGGGPVADWEEIQWTCNAPVNTTVTVEVRASNDPGDLGAWIEIPAPGGDLSDYIANGTRYFQYRVSLATGDNAVSPSFEDLHIGWTYLADVDEGGQEGGSFSLQAVMANPSGERAGANIRFTLAQSGKIVLVLHDLEGRKIMTLAEGEYEPGVHQVTVDGLASGVYLCRLTTADGSCARKLVVP